MNSDLPKSLAIAIFLAAGLQPHGHADEQPRSSKKIAMSIPGVPKQHGAAKFVAAQSPVNFAKTQAAEEIDPQIEFGSRAHISRPVPKNPLPDDVKAALYNGADKIEQFSRTYNRHFAELIVWIANSVTQPKGFTPASGPYFKPPHTLEQQGLKHNERILNSIELID
ncbi:MAG: hypothetical protein K2X27_16005 [Candidatus Obscuribacterales bacterium]|nr:hypothetical protein [Candidatus Obscuribacterales bacterium]